MRAAEVCHSTIEAGVVRIGKARAAVRLRVGQSLGPGVSKSKRGVAAEALPRRHLQGVIAGIVRALDDRDLAVTLKGSLRGNQVVTSGGQRLPRRQQPGSDQLSRSQQINIRQAD